MVGRAICPLEEGYRALSAYPLLGSADQSLQPTTCINYLYVGFGDPDDAALYYAPTQQVAPVEAGGAEALGEREQQPDVEDPSPRELSQCAPLLPSSVRAFGRGPRPDCFGRRPPALEIGEDSPTASPASTRPPSPGQIDWGYGHSGEHRSSRATPSSQEGTVAAGARGAHRRECEARPRDIARARDCFGDELLEIDKMIQLFLLDSDMHAVRLLMARPREREVLQDFAQCYRLTVHCAGRGKARVVVLKKTKSSGRDVNRARLRCVLGKENELRRPTCEPPAAVPPVRAVYRAKSRMTRLPAGYARHSECRALEAAYRAYKQNNPRNDLLQHAKARHELMRSAVTDEEVETGYDRLMRAEDWLALQRQQQRGPPARQAPTPRPQ
eukprot:TRINITY_DN884_c1_g3_i1.p1 TRINITY_DN884_c1_g3~~TRINITY_DN884_c1_g3_i1.p1  ORF type:complete len:416 (+),score=138.96 TRINITY_DN884_c1_g3_i1:94-1248(+)